MSTRPENLPQIADYDHVPQGWARVAAALSDRIPWADVGPVVQDWKASRFTDTESILFVVEEGVMTPGGVEAWQARTGLDRPVARPKDAQ